MTTQENIHVCCLTRITLEHNVKGGMEVHIKTLAEALRQRGIRITVITTEHPDKKKFISEKGIRYYFVPKNPSGRYSISWGKNSLKFLKDLNALEPVDLIWGEGAGAYYYIKFGNKFLGVPVVTILQGTFSGELRTLWEMFCQNKNKGRFFLKRFAWRIKQYLQWDLYYARGADAIIAPSNQIASAARLDYGLHRSKIYPSINGVDVGLFRPDDKAGRAIRAKHGLNAKPLLFTCARLEPEKGIQFLLQALGRLKRHFPSVQLLIAGDGSFRKELEVISQQLGIVENVIFLGHIPNEDLPGFYNACDVFAYPTLWWEAFGISVAEAMACGKPVVATKLGGILTSVDSGKQGFLHRPRDLNSLTTHIASLLSSRTMRERFGLAAREKAVAKLSNDRMVNDAIKVFFQLLGDDRLFYQRS